MSLIKINDNEYFSREGLNSSLLKQFAKSPRHAKVSKETPQSDNENFRIGRLTHERVLLGKTSYRVADKELRLTKKADKEETLSFFKDNLSEELYDDIFMDDVITASRRDEALERGKFISASEAELIENMYQSVVSHEIGSIISNNPDDAELAGFVEDPETGLLLKAKFDYIPKNGPIVWDLKTCADASPRKFAYSVRDFSYDIQLCHYLYVAQLLGLEKDRFVFVAVEKTKVCGTACYELDPEKMEFVKKHYHQLLRKYAKCLESDDFSECYPQDIITIK